MIRAAHSRYVASVWDCPQRRSNSLPLACWGSKAKPGIRPRVCVTTLPRVYPGSVRSMKLQQTDQKVEIPMEGSNEACPELTARRQGFGLAGLENFFKKEIKLKKNQFFLVFLSVGRDALVLVLAAPLGRTLSRLRAAGPHNCLASLAWRLSKLFRSWNST
jgi:hypothetical protein